MGAFAINARMLFDVVVMYIFLALGNVILAQMQQKKSFVKPTDMTGGGGWRDPNEYRADVIRVTLVIFLLTIVVRYIESNIASNDTVACKVLVKNAERYFSMAAQDLDSAVRLRHSAMAVANLQAARQMFSDGVIENATGLDVHVTSQRMETSLNKNESSSSTRPTVAARRSQKNLPIWP